MRLFVSCSAYQEIERAVSYILCDTKRGVEPYVCSLPDFVQALDAEKLLSGSVCPVRPGAMQLPAHRYRNIGHG
jgi:hypothetical protein